MHTGTGVRPRSVPARIAALLWIGVAILGCDVVPTTLPTPAEIVDGPGPIPGYMHVRAIPPVAEEPLVIRLLSNGEASRSSDEFATGDFVAFDLAGFPGERGFTVNGVACSGMFTVRPNLEVDVVMNLTEAGCHVGTEEVHEPADGFHGYD